MIHRLLTISIILIISLPTGYAGGWFEFTPLARQAYDKVVAMKYDDANALIARLYKEEPDNLLVHFIESQRDCLAAFVSEEDGFFNRFTSYQERRINAIRRGNAASPYYLFTQAQIRLFAAMNKAKFGKYLAAFNEAGAAYELLESNQKKFPTFLPNKMSLGVLHAVVGSIPDNYKWGVKLVSGMEGTVQQGQSEIEEVLRYAKQNDFIFEQEAIVMYAFLMLHLGKQNDNAWAIVNTAKLKPKENQLACFALATVAMRTGRCDKAIEVLLQRPSASGYFPIAYLDYMLGICKLFRGDSDADVYLKKFITYFKGRNYIKEAFQKLGWYEWLKNDWQAYNGYLKMALVKGRADIGGDKNALKEAKTMATPDQTLLRGRLYFDGGYYQKAYDFLKSKKESDFTQPAVKLEYWYRLARVVHLLKNTNEAISYYEKTIQLGKETKYYFACNAALQLGGIYEELKNYPKAKEYYALCLKLNPDDYADGLHSKAKAGMGRLRNVH